MKEPLSDSIQKCENYLFQTSSPGPVIGFDQNENLLQFTPQNMIASRAIDVSQFHCCISNSRAYNNIFFGIKPDIMVELPELAKMIKCFSHSRCSAKSFIKKSCHAHAQSVMDCAEIKSDTLCIYSINFFPLIAAMGMVSKQNLAGAGQEWLHSMALQRMKF